MRIPPTIPFLWESSFFGLSALIFHPQGAPKSALLALAQHLSLDQLRSLRLDVFKESGNLPERQNWAQQLLEKLGGKIKLRSFKRPPSGWDTSDVARLVNQLLSSLGDALAAAKRVSLPLEDVLWASWRLDLSPPRLFECPKCSYLMLACFILQTASNWLHPTASNGWFPEKRTYPSAWPRSLIASNPWGRSCRTAKSCRENIIPKLLS